MGCSPPLADIVEACTRNKPEERPNLDDIYAMVEKMKITTQQYMNVDHVISCRIGIKWAN